MTYFTLYVTLPTVTFPDVYPLSWLFHDLFHSLRHIAYGYLPARICCLLCPAYIDAWPVRYEVRGYPEVAVLVGVGEQVVENVVDGDGPVEVERDATDRHHDLRPGR